MNLTNRGVPGMKERRPSGEPGMAEVGPPVILSLGVAGYCSVSAHSAAPFLTSLSGPPCVVRGEQRPSGVATLSNGARPAPSFGGNVNLPVPIVSCPGVSGTVPLRRCSS